MRIVIVLLTASLTSGCHRGAPSESTNATVQALASSAPSSDACKACQAKHCSAVVAACTSKECLDVRACIHDTKCADTKGDSLVPCYCGGVQQDDCFFAKALPSGPCKAAIEVGAKSSTALEIGQRYFDMAFPTGQAIQLTTCEQTFCKACL